MHVNLLRRLACAYYCEGGTDQEIGKLLTHMQGNISNYFVERYGFSPDCKVVAFTGDNPGR